MKVYLELIKSLHVVLYQLVDFDLQESGFSLVILKLIINRRKYRLVLLFADDVLHGMSILVEHHNSFPHWPSALTRIIISKRLILQQFTFSILDPS